MSQDFFLLNRAHQLARLSTRPECAIPPLRNRRQLPQLLRDYYQLLDEILVIERAASEQPAFSLTPRQRGQLKHFERLIVQLRFSADERTKQPAVQWIRAIFGDAAYFSGLKPLPHYTDRFAYETLFPSWLNLLSALMIPDKTTGKTKLDGKQQGAVFEFLSGYALSVPQQENAEKDNIEKDSQVVAYMTMLANRLPEGNCSLVFQRFIELLEDNDSLLIDSVASFEEASRDANELTRWLREFITVQHNGSPSTPSKAPRVSLASRPPARRTIPSRVQERLLELLGRQQWDDYFRIAGPICRLIETGGPLSVELASMLQAHAERSGELLSMVQRADGTILSMTAQHVAALLATEQLERDPRAQLQETAAIVGWLAERVDPFPETIGDRFCEKLRDSNSAWRTELMNWIAKFQSGESVGTGHQGFIDDCLERARRATDSVSVIEWLAYAGAFSANSDLHASCFTLGALLGVIENRSIGGKELTDLLEDLQADPSAALQTLASPLMSLSGKSQRLASLYLTLNDISETLRSTRTCGNFSVVRARYSAMSKHEG